MADPAEAPPLRVLITGAESFEIAAFFAAKDLDTSLFVEDPHDRARLADMAARYAPGLRITDETCVADIILGDGAAAPSGTPSFAFTRLAPTSVAVRISCHTAPPLIEVSGTDQDRSLARLAAAIGAHVIAWPESLAPLSQYISARFSCMLERLVLTGPTPWEIDAALEAAGFTILPFETQDRFGVDVVLAARQSVNGDDLPLFRRAVGEGRLGRKVGVGWFRYPGGGGKVEDPLIEDMASEEAHFAGIERRDMTAQDILDDIRISVQADLRDAITTYHLDPADIRSLTCSVLGCPADFIP